MKKLIFISFAFTILFPAFIFIAPLNKCYDAYAQTEVQCTEQLDKAEEEYLLGKWQDAIELIEQCLKKENVSETEKGRAYRILGLVYIAVQLEKEANDAVKNLLLMVPNYKIDPDRDPPSLQKIIDNTAQTLNPKITNISPSSVDQEEKGITLTVSGTNFVYGSVVKFNEATKLTTYVSSTELKAEIPSTDLLNEGEFNINVYSPIMGGKTSNTEKFIVKKVSGFPWTWIAVGGAAIAAAVVAIVSLGGDEEVVTPTIADPPGRP